MVLAPPFGDAFDFRNTHLAHTFCSLLTCIPVVDLKSYPDAVFAGCVAVGVFIIRRQRKRINAERPEFKAWDVVLLFYIAIQVILLVMPVIISPLFQTELSLIQISQWVPPAGGIYAGSVSFFYATYCLTGIGM
jgi:hypothetical protein